MQAVMDFAKDLPKQQKFVCGLVVAFFLGKSHYYRFIRSYGIPLCSAVILYRVLKTNSNGLLDDIHEILSKPENSRAIKVATSDVLGLVVCLNVLDFADKILTVDFAGIKRAITDFGFGMIKHTSYVQSILQKEQSKLEVDFDKELKTRSRALGETFTALPKEGLNEESILTLMRNATKSEDLVWSEGKLSGAVYNGEAGGHTAFLNKAFAMYSISNPLFPDIWPSVMKFDSEVVAMTAALVNGGLETVCGTSSSGGTESVILAVKAHRDYYRDNFGIHNPELVCGVSAHAAVDKACDLMKIKLIKVALDPVTFKIDLNAMCRAIGPNTIMLYGSAPTYPYGTIDDITGMSKLALQYNIGLHVDGCMGGFVLPFAKRLGYDIPDFDFTLSGVTSMSMDTHKYGCALKGSSVVLYRTKELRHSQYFCYADWTGGMYTTPTISGSRSGGLIAQCWASLMVHGDEGYTAKADDIMKTAMEIGAGISAINELRIIGSQTPQSMIVCFAAAKTKKEGGLNIYSLGDKMAARGWHMHPLQNPACLHICVTVHQVGRAHEFLDDLQASVKDLIDHPIVGELEGRAAVYGSTAGLPPGPVNELLKAYNDVVYKV